MQLLIDESQHFKHVSQAPMNWKIAAVGGVLLPDQGRAQWLKKHPYIEKGSYYIKTASEQQICTLLDDMIECNVQGVLVVGDIGHANTTEAAQTRQDLITPLYNFANNEPAGIREALYAYLDDLQGKTKPKLSLQDFFKTWSLLEVITMLVKLYLNNLHSTQAIDLESVEVIIDDQCPASVNILTNFTVFFLNRRSQNGSFSCPKGSINRINHFLRKENDSTFLDLKKLLKHIRLGKHGDKIDNRYPELKIADLFTTFSRNALNGGWNGSPKIIERLRQIIKNTQSMQASNQDYIDVHFPVDAKAAVNRLLNDLAPE